MKKKCALPIYFFLTSLSLLAEPAPPIDASSFEDDLFLIEQYNQLQPNQQAFCMKSLQALPTLSYSKFCSLYVLSLLSIFSLYALYTIQIVIVDEYLERKNKKSNLLFIPCEDGIFKTKNAITIFWGGMSLAIALSYLVAFFIKSSIPTTSRWCFVPLLGNFVQVKELFYLSSSLRSKKITAIQAILDKAKLL